MDKHTIYLFVYDSMRKGRLNNSLLENSEFITSATLHHFDSFDMGSFISVLQGEGQIEGDIYRVQPKVIKSIDRYQGYGKLFKRTPTEYTLPSGEKIIVELYTLMDQCFARSNRKL